MSKAYEAGSAFSAEMGAPDRGAYRVTPAGEPKVPELILPGMTIRTSYSSGGTVVKVAGPHLFKAKNGQSFEHFTVIYVKPEQYGRHSSSDYHWINELVSVSGRILKLFEANQDEVFVEDGSIRFQENRRGQFSLF